MSSVYVQLQQTNPAFLTGLYNQYLFQQNNTQLNAAATSIAPPTGTSNGNATESGCDQKSDDLHSNQPAISPMENNLMLQINADKQSTTASTTNNEILQQLYNYSQMSGELIK